MFIAGLISTIIIGGIIGLIVGVVFTLSYMTLDTFLSALLEKIGIG